MKNICLAFIPPLSAFMSHYEWLLKIDWKTWCRVASSTTFALHITCNEWVTSTFWHHIFCHCRNLFEALLLLSILRNKRTKRRFFKILICYIFCALGIMYQNSCGNHITSLDIFLTLGFTNLAISILSWSYQITLCWKIREKSFVEIEEWFLLLWSHMFDIENCWSMKTVFCPGLTCIMSKAVLWRNPS